MNSNSNHYQKDEVKNTSSSRDGSPNHQQNANADKLDKSRPSAVSDVASPPSLMKTIHQLTASSQI